MTRRSHTKPVAMGSSWEEPPKPEAKASGREEQPEERWLCRHRRAYRSYPTLKVRNSSGKEIPLVQRKTNPSKMVGVARGHQRADTLKPYSQKTSQSNHTRTTALSNSMKLKPCLQGNPRQAGHGGEV